MRGFYRLISVVVLFVLGMVSFVNASHHEIEIVSVNDFPLDEDSDGFYDYLILEVTISVPLSGTYSVETELEIEGFPENFWPLFGTTAREMDYNLTKGENTLQLKFSGIELYNNGKDGPYSLQGIDINPVDPNFDKEVSQFPYETNSYAYTSFQRPPAQFIGTYTDSPVDADGDGLYDFLIIHADINATKAGEYLLTHQIEPNEDNKIMLKTFHLSEGENVVDIEIPAIRIYRNGVNTTYDFQLIRFQNALFEVVEEPENSHVYTTTSVYNSSQFEGPAAVFNGHITDYGLDTNGDGLFDFLVLELGINTTKEGTYRVDYDYRAPSYGKGTREFFELSVGENIVQLKISGVTTYNREDDGEHSFSEFEIRDEENNLLGEWDTLHTTRTYGFTEFQKPFAQLTGQFTDEGTDLGGDGLFDYLAIEADVNVTRSGNYRFRAEFVDKFGEEIVHNAGGEFFLDSGLHKVPITIRGDLLRAHEVNGSLTLQQLMIIEVPGPIHQNVHFVYTTSEYNYTQFEEDQSQVLEPTMTGKLQITDVEVEVDGKKDPSVREGEKISKEAEPGVDVKFDIEVRNLFTREEGVEIEDVEIEVTIEDIDDGDDLDEEADNFDLRAGTDDREKVRFTIPMQVDEGTYNVVIIARGDDKSGNEYTDTLVLDLEVEKEKHNVIIKNFAIEPSMISCQRQARVTTSILNLGSEDEEDMVVEWSNSELGLSHKESAIDLDEGIDDSSYKKTLSFAVSDDIGAGSYPIEVTAYYDGGDLADSDSVELKVENCVQETESAHVTSVAQTTSADKKSQPITQQITTDWGTPQELNQKKYYGIYIFVVANAILLGIVLIFGIVMIAKRA